MSTPSIDTRLEQILVWLAPWLPEGAGIVLKGDIQALLAQVERESRVDELERLNLYYLRHDGEGEHQLAAQFDKRIDELKALTIKKGAE